MIKEIIINSSSSQNRVAIIEDGNLVDFFIENPEKRRTVGDIYHGTVARILPGIKAAFVDIGEKHDAFLHFSDVGDRLEAFQAMFSEDDIDEDESDADADDDESPNGFQVKSGEQEKQSFIPKLYKGQDIMVQIIKEPVGNKGVRVTYSISIPGRFCVLLPFDNKIGISKKITDFKERRRLRKLAREILPKKCGLIIRTAAKEQAEDVMAADLKYLVKTWEDIQESIKNVKPPVLVYADLSTTNSIIRDLFTPDVSRIFIDSKKMYKEIKNYVHLIQPELVDKIELFKDDEPIFETFGVEEQISVLLSRKVPLPSGGHIVIDITEAMLVIDVNSGRYAAKKEQELNSLKTDLEAAREIVRQLRLRDFGGLILIDFIDLAEDKNRKKIYDELKKEFKKDRAKVAILPMTDFGIIQLTRQRVRENIMQSMFEKCPYCDGSGILTKKSNLLHEIEEWLKKHKSQCKGGLIIKANPHLGSLLREGKINTLTRLQFKYLKRIRFQEDEKVSPDKFYIFSSRDGSNLTAEFK